MANFVALSVYSSDQAAAATSVAFPTSANSVLVIETVSNLTIAGVTILSKLVLKAAGLNLKERVYYSATSVSGLVTALASGFVSLNVFKNELQSSAAIAVAFPVGGASGMVIETTTGTVAGTTILSKIVFPSSGLYQKPYVYLSAQTVAAIVTALG